MNHHYLSILILTIYLQLFTISCGDKENDSNSSLIITSSKHIIGKNNRIVVDDYDDHLSRIGMLRNEELGGFCTATLVSRYLIITAAHCVVNEKEERLTPISEFNFYLGYKSKGESSSYFAQSKIEKVWFGGIFSVNIFNMTNDWAILRLEKPLGDDYGWFELHENFKDSEFSEMDGVHFAGYSPYFTPDKVKRLTKMDTPCSIFKRGPNSFYSNCDAAPGDSGGVAYICPESVSKKCYIVGTFSSYGKGPGGSEHTVFEEYSEEYAAMYVAVPSFIKKLNELKSKELKISKNEKSKVPTLHEAILLGDSVVVSKLLKDPNVDINVSNVNGETPLYLAVEKEEVNIVKLLLAHSKIKVNLKSIYGTSPLHVAVKNYDMTKVLLAHPRIDSNVIDKKGQETPLHIAVRNSKGSSVVELLLRHALIKVNIKNRYGDGPLHVAAKKGHSDIIKRLLTHDDIEVNLQNISRATPLHESAYEGHVQVVKLLLGHLDIEPNIQDQSKNSPLHSAVLMRRIGVINELLVHPNIDANIQSEDGSTPLNIAAYIGYKDVVQLLFTHQNIDINIKNRAGKTPLENAKAEEYTDIINLINGYKK